MGKKVVIIGIVYIAILMVVFAINSSRGEKIDFYEIDMLVDSTLEPMTVSCNAFNESVISTEALFDEFIEDCEIDTTLEFTESYFYDQALVVHFYDGVSTRKPKSYFDYYWSIDGYEVIKVQNEFSLFNQKTDVFVIHLLEMEKEDIGSSNILFD
jgi:hypothetical protein